MQKAETNSAQSDSAMDYAQHARTYKMFLSGAKYTTILVVALLVAMAAGLIGSFGFISSLIIFILISAVGIYSLR